MPAVPLAIPINKINTHRQQKNSSRTTTLTTTNHAFIRDYHYVITRYRTITLPLTFTSYMHGSPVYPSTTWCPCRHSIRCHVLQKQIIPPQISPKTPEISPKIALASSRKSLSLELVALPRSSECVLDSFWPQTLIPTNTGTSNYAQQ